MNTQEIANHVINAAIESYTFNGFDVKVISDKEESLYFDFLIPEKRRIEKVYPSKGFESTDLKIYEEYRNKGYEILIIVPLSSIWKAHEIFRNQVDWIQGWWTKDDFIKFSSPRRP